MLLRCPSVPQCSRLRLRQHLASAREQPTHEYRRCPKCFPSSPTHTNVGISKTTRLRSVITITITINYGWCRWPAYNRACDYRLSLSITSLREHKENYFASALRRCYAYLCFGRASCSRVPASARLVSTLDRNFSACAF